MPEAVRRSLLSLALLILVAFLASCDMSGGTKISAEELERDVRFLSSDDMAGRDTGEAGIAAAEEYIAAGFEEAGLIPLPGNDSFFVPFTLYRQGYDLGNTKLTVRQGESEASYSPGREFRPFDFSDDGAASGEIVFAGYGITAPEHEYDDYADLDVAGKIVLVFRHEPGEKDEDSPFDGTESTNHALFNVKARNAQDHGAAGMLLVTDPLHHDPGDDLRMGRGFSLDPPEEQATSDEEPDEQRFLAMQVTRELVEGWAVAAGTTLAGLQQSLDDGVPAADLSIGEVHAALAIERLAEPEKVTARNVVGFIPGADPELWDEWILIGAHHDHIGGYHGDGDTIFNGADDNASGTSGLLALARAFGAERPTPPRSLVFATFSAEEKGLLGSRAMIARELIPIDQIVFMFNMDMLGRNSDEPMLVYGDGFVRGFRAMVEEENAATQVSLEFAGAEYAGNSDHDPFYRQDVPFAFFFTGVHEDYHQLGDHPDKLDYERMEKIVSLTQRIVGRLATQPTEPSFIHHINWLGAQFEVLDEAEGRVIALTAVDEPSRAASAGLRSGDRLVAFDDAAVAPDEVGPRFREIEPGSQVAMTILRGAEEHRFDIERARTGYLGVVSGRLEDDTRQEHGLPDNEGVLLRSVVPEGPAASAGLQEGDILLRIGGQPIDRRSMRTRLMQIGAGETVDVMVLREGERETMSLTLGERPRRP